MKRPLLELGFLALLAASGLGCGEDDAGVTREPVVCPGQVVGSMAEQPVVVISSAEPDAISGRANHVDGRRHRIVLWAKTDKWYVQPLTSDPYTDICSDGSWSNWTHSWNRIVALVVDDTYDPGATRVDHPSLDPGVLAWDEAPDRSIDRMVDFSDHRWRVKRAEQTRAGPGPNYFSDDAENVWVNASGLHLRITKRDGKWFCTEIVLDRSLGHGAYTFQLASRIDNLNPQMVLAGFTYETTDREIDIEFSHALANPENAQFVVQPWDRVENRQRFLMPSDTLTTHRFEWSDTSILFTSWKRHGDFPPDPADVIETWTYTGDDIPPPGGERMRFNLWLFDGQDPAGGVGHEVVVRSFEYTP